MYCAKYENWTKDIYRETYNIAEFLGIEICDALARNAELKYSIERNRKRLDSNHITDGATGKYKLALTGNQIKQIEDKFNGWLTRHSYI